MNSLSALFFSFFFFFFNDTATTEIYTLSLHDALPIPAGCEVIRGSGEGPFSRFEARHEQALFYLRGVGTMPTVLKFRMRAGFAGRYSVPAPSAVAMYDENLSGRGTNS